LVQKPNLQFGTAKWLAREGNCAISVPNLGDGFKCKEQALTRAKSLISSAVANRAALDNGTSFFRGSLLHFNTGQSSILECTIRVARSQFI
jgi:hypothetical protein